jgi:phosphohistidine phosphatase
VSELVVLRHAKSAWPGGVEDRDRPLAPRGQRATELVGRFLARSGLCPERVVTSPARRAYDTARRVIDEGGCGAEVVVDDRLYEGDALAVLRDQPAAVERLLLVGHEPELVDLVAALTGATVRLPTAGLVVVEVDGPWSSQPEPGNQLRTVIGPRQLDAR